MSSIPDASRLACYASIMVPVNLGPGADSPIKVAASLASGYASRLIGVAAEDLEFAYYGDGVAAVDAVMFESAKKTNADNLAKAEAVFRHAAGTTHAIEWRSATYSMRDFVLTQARAADLVVLARQGPSDPEQGNMALSPGSLVMDLGRPILVVPPGVETLSAKRVVVAWKNTREARRAVCDALPLLKRAEFVLVTSVGDDAETQGTNDVCQYLVEHGVSARSVLRLGENKYAIDELTELAALERADLIVAGAYGHSRALEWIFGGLTSDLINGSPVCCLMSH